MPGLIYDPKRDRELHKLAEKIVFGDKTKLETLVTEGPVSFLKKYIKAVLITPIS